MKSSASLRKTARLVERGAAGLYVALNTAGVKSLAPEEYLHMVTDRPEDDRSYDWPQDIRVLALCLAAAIAESEGD